MGRDKALLPYQGATLLEHAVSMVRSVTDDIRILCGPSRRYEDFGVSVVQDVLCDAGPAGGLYSALLSSALDGRDRTLWLGVDLPLVPAAHLSQLLLGLDEAEAAMARSERGPEPLCAAFRTEPALKAVRRSLLGGELKLISAIEGLSVHFVEGDAHSFANLNSPSDYEQIASGALRPGQPVKNA